MERPPASPIVVGLGAFAAVVGLLVLAIGIAQYTGFALQAELHDKVLDRPSPFLPAVRSREQVELGGYRWIDRKAGVVGIPLERALELTLQDRRQP